jgi:hypothetical protein
MVAMMRVHERVTTSLSDEPAVHRERESPGDHEGNDKVCESN